MGVSNLFTNSGCDIFFLNDKNEGISEVSVFGGHFNILYYIQFSKAYLSIGMQRNSLQNLERQFIYVGFIVTMLPPK